MREADYHPLLQCGLLGVHYDTVQRAATLALPAGECTDMRGAIEYVTARFPNARAIRTLAGAEVDTVYLLGPNGWVAQRWRPRTICATPPETTDKC